MSYQNEGVDVRAEVQQGNAVDSVVYYPKVDGKAVVPTSAFATVCGPDGSVRVPRAAVVPDATTGALVVSQAFAIGTWDLYEDYFVDWEFTANAIPYADRQFFDVVKNKLLCPLSVSDFRELYPDIEDHLEAVTDETQNETTEEVARRFIRRGWAFMLDQIRSAGKRPSLILDRARLVSPGLHYSLAFCCEALVRAPGSIWQVRADRHIKLAEQTMRGLGELRYDVSQVGLADPKTKVNVSKKGWSV